MKFSAGVVLTLLVSPASTFVQRPSLVFQTKRPTFRHDRKSNNRSSQLHAVEIANVFTAIAVDPEVATAAANSLGLLDVAVFLVPLTALAAGASAISQRDLIRSEIDTTERTLAETKALLEKSDQTIKISFATAAATFALAFAYELGVISIPETPSSSVSSSSEVNRVTKAQQVSETKAPSKIASPKPVEPQKTIAEVKTEKPKATSDLRAIPPVPALEKGPDNYDALFDKLIAPKADEKVEAKEAVVDQPKEKEELSEQQPKEGIVDSLLPKAKEEAIVETKDELPKKMLNEVIPEQIKEQGGVVNSLTSKISDAKDSPKESKTETPKEKEGLVDSLMSKLNENTKEETTQESPKSAATEQAKPSEESKEATEDVVTELPKAEVAKAETQEVKKIETKVAEEEVKKTPEQKPTEAANDVPKEEQEKEEPKKADAMPAPVKIVARAPDLEPAKGGGVVESLMQRLNEKQKEGKVEDVKPKESVEVKPKVESEVKPRVESTKETAVKDKTPEQPKSTPVPKESVAPKVEPTKEVVKAKTPEPPKSLIAPKLEKAKEDAKDSKTTAPKEPAKQVTVSSKPASQPAAAPAFGLGDSQMVVAGVAVASIGLAAILIGSGDDNGSSPSSTQPSSTQGNSNPPFGPPQKSPRVPKPSDASYLNSLTREETALKNKGQVRGSYLDVIDDTSASSRLKGKKSMNSPYLESLPNIKLNSVPAGQSKVPPPAKVQQPPPPPHPRPEALRPQPVPEVRQPIPPSPQSQLQQAMPPEPVMSEPKPEPQNLSPEPRSNSGGYLGALSNAPGMPPPGPKKSFSPMGRKYSSETSGTGASSYLDSMSSRTFSQPPSYNSPPQNPPPSPSNASFDPNGSLGRGMSSSPPGTQFGSSPGSSPNAPIPPSGPPPPARPSGPIKNFSQMGRRYTATQSGTGVGSYLDNISPSERDRTN
ncbi:hypothetical protein FisN_6Lh380 [Fistulifera solaris]|uniref:Uncharacterized protein n=1 Tax=Fistulifera solaris TaxID=1519565 RepID=A0A1Z5JKQ8_FISSO|nr:hypothetical protein FisN_6Lh380 [Fistulifera solaris]|eukprot:GAX14600.1 hypothetical protein FisN_6Lh380 [Fistulifera solaris]